jgi:hypothetical protein
MRRRILAPPNSCIRGALSINRASCCFDTSTSRYQRPTGVPSCIFGGQQAQTATSKETGGGVLNWQKIPHYAHPFKIAFWCLKLLGRLP